MGELNLSDLTENDYSQYNLQSNPFPSIEIPHDGSFKTADRKEILDDFKKNLINSIHNKKPTSSIIIGEYGAGKSHLLKFFKHAVNTQLSETDVKVFAFYVPSLGNGIFDLYTYLIEDIGRKFLTKLSNSLISKYFVEIGSDEVRKYLSNNDLLSKYADFSSAPVDQILSNSRFFDIFHDMKNKYGSSDLYHTILLLSHPKYSLLAWEWIRGDKLTREDKKSVHVSTNVEDYGSNIINNLFEILFSDDCSSIVLLIDEFEGLNELNSIAVKKYKNDLRQFIDDLKIPLNIVFAITRYYWNVIKEQEGPLLRRIAQYDKSLSPLTPEDVAEFVQYYLDEKRIHNKFPIKVDDVKPELFPFSNSAITEISKISAGKPSDILRICRLSLDKALDQNAEKIDPRIIGFAVS